ncbi:hypothetical protein PPNSA23_30160 [Phyllobacterium phragmitis]|uniref:L-lactate permease n=2 Tax=Phyllobacterium phragmitis TaxID=2670329 RepID=A0ABQ0H2B7_9HYPH
MRVSSSTRANYAGAQQPSLSLRKERTDAGGILAVKTKDLTAMTDAQIGLIVATPIIVVFAVALYRMGVLQRYSAVSAVVFSVAIAAILFMQQ